MGEQESAVPSGEELIAAKSPAIQENIAHLIAQHGQLSDLERDYFSLPHTTKRPHTHPLLSWR